VKRLALLTLVVALLGLTPTASANHYIGYHWRRAANPKIVDVQQSLQAAWVNPVAAAVADWNKSSVIGMAASPAPSSTAAARQRCAWIRGAVHLCSGNYGNTGWVGLTNYAVSGRHIIGVRIRLNTPYIPVRYRQMVACHELGHALGLAHRAQSTSCMKQGVTREHPDQHDYGELATIYQHLDGATAETVTTTRTFSIQ
jgi:predicted Zn-dependent protease